MDQVILQPPQPTPTGNYDDNCREYAALSRQLLNEGDPAAFWKGLSRLHQLNVELEALPQ